jgi:hypothetical protein
MRIGSISVVALSLAVVLGAPLHAQSQDVAEAARLAKQKKQQKQTDPAENAAKPKVYTNDEIPEAKTSAPEKAPAQGAPAAGGSTASNAKPTSDASAVPAKGDAVILRFELGSQNMKRPGTTDINWQVQNKSASLRNFTVTMVIKGPCGFHDQQSHNFELTQGGAMGDNLFGTAFYESNCAGTYTYELQLSSGGHIIETASTTASVQ